MHYTYIFLSEYIMLLALRSSIKYEIGAAHGKTPMKKNKNDKMFHCKKCSENTRNLGHDKKV